MSYKYKYTFHIQEGKFHPNKEKKSVEISPGVRVAKNDIGYADDILMVSMVDGPGDLVLSSKGNPPPKEMLERCIKLFKHIIKEHC